MKNFKLSKIVSIGFLLLSTAVLVFTLSACAPRTLNTIPPTTLAPRVVYVNNGFDWGWLGLIGLFGLGGLAGGRKRGATDTTTRY